MTPTVQNNGKCVHVNTRESDSSSHQLFDYKDLLLRWKRPSDVIGI